MSATREGKKQAEEQDFEAFVTIYYKDNVQGCRRNQRWTRENAR